MGRGLDRPGEDLAVGEVLAAVGRLPDSIGDVQIEVCALALDMDLASRLHPLDHPIVTLSKMLPLGHRVVLVHEAGVEEEVLVVGEAHLGIHRVGFGREQGHHPPILPGRAAAHRGVHERLACLRCDDHPVRVDIRELARVGVADDVEGHVEVVGHPLVGLPHVGELLVGRVLIEDGIRMGHEDLDLRMGASSEAPFVEGEDQRLGEHRPTDLDLVALLYLRGVIDKNIHELLDTQVFQVPTLYGRPELPE